MISSSSSSFLISFFLASFFSVQRAKKQASSFAISMYVLVCFLRQLSTYLMWKEKTILYLPTCFLQLDCIYIRVGKTGSLGPWSRVIVYCSKLSFCQNDSSIGGSFWQKDSLQYTMTLLQDPKDPVLPSLIYTYHYQTLMTAISLIPRKGVIWCRAIVSIQHWLFKLPGKRFLEQEIKLQHLCSSLLMFVSDNQTVIGRSLEGN